MTLWLTSDQHFGHANIIGYCGRPFSDVHEMNVALAHAWRSRVQPDDTVLHLGDVSLLSKPSQDPVVAEGICELPGRIALVPGNHDRSCMVVAYRSWGWRVLKPFAAGDAWFAHRPGPLPKGLWGGVRLIVHGHTHGHGPGGDGFVDVGVDAWADYAPVRAVDIVGEATAAALLERLAP